MSIWVNTLVRNEEKYVWFAVMSVIDYVDKVLIWDTGSDDNTVNIILEIKRRYPHKIEFEKMGKVSINEFPQIRQRMLEKTRSDWLIIVDGDEVWWNDTIEKTIEQINKETNNLDTIVNRYFNVVGDIFHYQPEIAGMYELDGVKGHLNIRAFNRKIPGLYADKPHGQQGYFDHKGLLIQERDSSRRLHIKKPAYLHFTHLERSLTHNMDVPKRKIKLKVELGKPFPPDFYYPEVFFRPRPEIISSPWLRMTNSYYIKALIETPLRFVKRHIFKQGTSGY